MVFIIALLIGLIAYHAFPAPVNAADFWLDGYESAASCSSYDVGGSGGCTSADFTPNGSTYAGASSSASIIKFYNAGTTDGGPHNVTNNRLAGGTLPDFFMIGYDVQFVGVFKWGAGQKMMRILTNMNTGAGPPNGLDVNFQLNGNGKTFTLENFNYVSGGSQENTCFAKAMAAAPTNDTWHRVVWEVKKNSTTTTADGYMKVYFDGTLIGSCLNKTLTRNASWLSDFWGGPGNYTSIGNAIPAPGNTMWVDNLRVIDCGADASGCTTFATTAPGGGGPPVPSTNTISIASSGVSSGVAMVSVTTDNNGVSTCTTPCTLTYVTDTVVTIEAPGTSGAFTFVDWSTGATACDSSVTVTCTITASSNKTATATYTPPVSPSAPPAPTGLQVTFVSQDATTASFASTWNQSLDPPSNNAVPKYNYHYGFNDGEAQVTDSVLTNALSFSMPYYTGGGANPGGSFGAFLCVWAVDDEDTVSADNQCTSFTVPALPQPVTARAAAGKSSFTGGATVQ